MSDDPAPRAAADRGPGGRARLRRRRTAPPGITPSHRMELPIVLRRLRVLRVADLTPRMRRITLTGPQLGPFRSAPPAHPDDPASAGGFDVPAFRTEAPDDYVKLFLGEPGMPPALPEQHDGHLHWPRRPAPIARSYTVRRFDPAAGELDIDFVLHGHGTAGLWARDAAVGDELHLGGPKAATLPPVGARWWLLAGDETALPAIGRFIEEHPEQDLTAVVVVEDAAEEQDLPGVTWVHRAGRRHHDGALLAEAVRALAGARPDGFSDGLGWMWIAGETSAVRELRTLAKELGVPRALLDATGYWRAPAQGNALGRLRVLQERTAEALEARTR